MRFCQQFGTFIVSVAFKIRLKVFSVIESIGRQVDRLVAQILSAVTSYGVKIAEIAETVQADIQYVTRHPQRLVQFAGTDRVYTALEALSHQ